MRKTLVTIWILSHLVAALIGVLIVVLSDEDIFRAIGIGVIGSGFVGLSLVAYVFLTHGTQTKLELLKASGILQVFPYRSVAIRSEYESKLQNARQSIDIIGFGLSSLLDDFGEHFPTWASRARVRILLIDPDYPSPERSFADQRDQEENDAPGTIRRQARTFVTRTAHLIRTNHQFSVRLYRAVPSINYFRIDNIAFWGPYFISERSRNMPTLLVSRTGILFQPLADHFEELWNTHSREIPGGWLGD